MSTEVEKQKKAVRQQLDKLEKSISSLSSVVGDLQVGLESVLRQEPETSCDAAPCDNTCPMSDEVSGFVIRVDNSVALIRALQSHLEI